MLLIPTSVTHLKLAVSVLTPALGDVEIFASLLQHKIVTITHPPSAINSHLLLLLEGVVPALVVAVPPVLAPVVPPAATATVVLVLLRPLVLVALPASRHNMIRFLEL